MSMIFSMMRDPHLKIDLPFWERSLPAFKVQSCESWQPLLAMFLGVGCLGRTVLRGCSPFHPEICQQRYVADRLHSLIRGNRTLPTAELDEFSVIPSSQWTFCMTDMA